jgi:hypothetical protein
VRKIVGEAVTHAGSVNLQLSPGMSNAAGEPSKFSSNVTR